MQRELRYAGSFPLKPTSNNPLILVSDGPRPAEPTQILIKLKACECNCFIKLSNGRNCPTIYRPVRGSHCQHDFAPRPHHLAFESNRLIGEEALS